MLNPKNHAVWRDLDSRYEMHRTLCRAFPGKPGRPRFLWRLEREDPVPVLLLQSPEEPELSAFPEGYLLEAHRPVPMGRFLERLERGQVVFFRLDANPVRVRNGKRYALPDVEAHLLWLKARMEQCAGCGLVGAGTRVVWRRWFRFVKPGTGDEIKVFAVRFEGTAVVLQPDLLRNAIATGIGRGRAWGLGLLSVAPVGTVVV